VGGEARNSIVGKQGANRVNIQIFVAVVGRKAFWYFCRAHVIDLHAKKPHILSVTAFFLSEALV